MEPSPPTAGPSGSAGSKTYSCPTCKKTFGRRDYLERHVLNHQKPAEVCPRCGKAFARADVLRKHLTSSCPSVRKSHADDASTAPEAAVPGSGRAKAKAGQGKQRTGSRGASLNVDVDVEMPESHTIPTPYIVRGRTSISHSAAGSGRMNRGDMHGDEREREGKRRRSSPNGSYVSGYTNGTAQMSNYWTKGLSEGLMQNHTHAHAMGALQPFASPASTYSRAPAQAPSLASGPGGYAYPAYTHSVPGSVGMPGDTPLNNSVNPELIGENMSELLQWLFQPPVHDPAAGQVAPPASDETIPGPIPPYLPPLTDSQLGYASSSTLPTSAPLSGIGTSTGVNTTPTSLHFNTHDSGSLGSVPLAYSTPQHPTDPSSQSPHKGNTAPLPISFVAPFPPVQDVQTKEPQPIHPYTHPNKWKAGLFPPFVERGPKRQLGQGRDVLTEMGRLDMLRLFDASEADARILTLDRMRYYLDVFFTRFASLYPIIHRPSLPFRSLAPDLLLAMIAIGIAYSGDGLAIHTAIRITRQLRYRIFMCLEDEARAPISVLQTALLVNHFSRSYGDSRQFDSGQLWHPPSIIACRLSGVFLPKFTPPGTDGSIDPLAYWLEWVEEEERKRIGYFAFMMDIENVALFKQLLQVQCVSLQTEMPLGSGPWQAQDPYEWNEMLRTYPLPLSFRTSLRHVISLGFIPPNLDDSHLWLVLHGLLSTSCSLLWRDMGDLSMMQDTHLTQWKSAMRAAFDTWRNYILALNSRSNLSSGTVIQAIPNGVNVGVGSDPAITGVPQSTPIGPHLIHHSAPIPMVRRIGIPFSLMGCLVLLTDTEQVRIYAGAMSISGRPIAPGEWTAASAYVNTWARSQDGAYACHYAALLLDEVYKEDWTICPTIIPWCAYVATLVIWTYTNILDGYEALVEPFVRFGHLSQYPPPRPANATDTFPHGPGGGPMGVSEVPAQHAYNISAPHAYTDPNMPNASVASSKMDTVPQIDVAAAGHAAEAYITTILACPHPFSLPDIPKSKCGGVIAYTAHQLGMLDRGMLNECCGVLYGLMREGALHGQAAA